MQSIIANVRAFARCERGNFGIIFALAAVPVLGVAGMALDYSRISSTRENLQASVDAAITAAAARRLAPLPPRRSRTSRRSALICATRPGSVSASPSFFWHSHLDTASRPLHIRDSVAARAADAACPDVPQDGIRVLPDRRSVQKYSAFSGG